MQYKLAMFCEIDKFASDSYCAIHNVDPTLNVGDITKVDEKSVPDFNVMVGGSPCFIAGTCVFTKNGYKNIETLNLTDRVLTHTGSFKNIKKIGVTKSQPIYELSAQGILPIRATKNHPFLVIRKDGAQITPPHWKEVCNITEQDYIAVPILGTESDCLEYNLTDENCWIIGRFLADGYISKKNIVLCIGKDKLSDLEHIREHEYKLYKKNASCYGCQIKDDELLNLIKTLSMNEKSYDKQLSPKLLIALTPEKLKILLEGYFSGDGCVVENHIQATTTSKRLAMTLFLAIQKAYKTGCRIYHDERPEKHVIEGRMVNQRDTFQIRFAPTPVRKSRFIIDHDNRCIWYPVHKIIDTGETEDVYNIEVCEDHSYVADNAVVHNCQDFSVAGKQAGAVWTCKTCSHQYNPLEAHWTKRDKCPKCDGYDIEKTRSSLVVEWLRFLREKKPRFAIYENVKNLTGVRFKDIFELFLKEIDEYGYNVYWKVLNAKDYGVPQNRERVYCVIIRKDLDNGKFQFPEKIPLTRTLQDVLEEEVDERFYLSDEKVATMIELTPSSSDDESEPTILDVKQMSREGKPRVYQKGISPTLTARDYKDPLRVVENGAE